MHFDTLEDFYGFLVNGDLHKGDALDICIGLDEAMRVLVFGQGNLPSIEALRCAIVFQKLEKPYCSKNKEYWEKVSDYFLQEFNTLDDSKNEKYIFNKLIYLADLFSKGYHEATIFLISRTLILDTRSADKKNEWVRSFEYFLLHVSPPIEIVVDVIKLMIDKNNFFNFSKNSQRSLFYWWLHVIWTHKPYMNHPLWKEFGLPLKELSDEALKRNDLATQMYIHFFAYQILGNLYQIADDWRVFNEAFNKPQAKAFASLHVKPCKQELSNGKKKIVFVKDRIVENAPFKVEYSLFSALMQDENFTKNYELFVLSMFYIDKAPDQEKEVQKLKNLGLNVVSPAQAIHAQDEYYNHLTKAIILHNWFMENGVDIMVGCVSGYDIMNFLFASRSAPKQIYWSHGDFEYDVVGIDKRISHFHRENPYTYERFDISILDEFHKPDEDKHKAMALEVRKRWLEEVIILGSIGRLVKIDNNEYISTIAQILKQNPNTIYLACGTGHEESIKQKLVKYDVPMDRFFFEGFVNAHVYGYVIDVYLNTFPEPSGEAVAEFLKKGDNKYVVSLEA